MAHPGKDHICQDCRLVFLSEFAKSHRLQCLHYVDENGFPTGKNCVFYSVRPEIYRKAIFVRRQDPTTPTPVKNVISCLSFSHLFTDKCIFFQLHVYSRIVTFNGQVRLITGECIYLMDIAARVAFPALREIE